MELYLIRHGQSTNNRGDARVPDPPLTDLGKQQADRAGRALRNLGITRLYCSAMLRAVQTAAIVGGHLGSAPHVFVGIHEWGGVWEDRVDGGMDQLPGLTRSQLRDVCPTAVLPDDVTDEGWCIQAFDAHELAYGGNDEQMLGLAHENCLRFIAHLDHHHHAREHEKVGAILHGGSGSMLLGAFFGLLPNETQNRFPHNNAGITKILRTPKYTQLLYQNQTSHLLKESEFDLEASSPMVIW